MKRKLPQWLLDVTNQNSNNNKKHKKNTEILNQNEDSIEPVTGDDGSNGMTSLVPLSNQQSPHIGQSEGQSAFSTRNNGFPEDSRNTDIVTNRDTNNDECAPNNDFVRVIKTELIEEEEDPPLFNNAEMHPIDHQQVTNTTPVILNAIPQTNMPSRVRRPVNYQNPLISISADIDSNDEDDEDDPFINDGSSDEYDPDIDN